MNKFTIYNQDKSQVLEYDNIDFNAGYLVDMEDVIHHDAIEGKAEKGHYQTIAEYENGGKDVVWVVDEEAIEPQEAYDEIIQYQIYIPYSKEYMEHKEVIAQYKDTLNKLAKSDHKLLKYLEGYYTDEEYEPIKQIREGYRKAIRELTKQLTVEDLYEIDQAQDLFK